MPQYFPDTVSENVKTICEKHGVVEGLPPDNKCPRCSFEPRPDLCYMSTSPAGAEIQIQAQVLMNRPPDGTPFRLRKDWYRQRFGGDIPKKVPS